MSERQMDAFARRVRSDDFFLASALEDYARSEGLDRAGLIARLGCEPQYLGAIGLCRRPRPGPNVFIKDIAQIARRFDLQVDILAEIVRRSDALVALREAEAEDVVAAARDRPAEPAPWDEAPE